MKWIIWFLLFILNGQANLEAWESITDQFDGIGMVCELPKKFLHKRSVNLCVLVLDPVIAFGRVQLHDDLELDWFNVIQAKFNFFPCLEENYCLSRRAINQFGKVSLVGLDWHFKPWLSFNLDLQTIFFKNLDFDNLQLFFGMLLGNDLVFENQQMEVFLRTQVTHLVVASGQNIAFLVEFLGLFLAYIPFYISRWIICILLFFYFVQVGFEPPIARAVMVYLILKRFPQISFWQLFLLLFWLFSAVWPFAILYSFSLQLSFLAFVGVLLAVKFLKVTSNLEFLDAIKIGFCSMALVNVFLFLKGFEVTFLGIWINVFIIPLLYFFDFTLLFASFFTMIPVVSGLFWICLNQLLDALWILFKVEWSLEFVFVLLWVVFCFLEEFFNLK